MENASVGELAGTLARYPLAFLPLEGEVGPAEALAGDEGHRPGTADPEAEDALVRHLGGCLQHAHDGDDVLRVDVLLWGRPGPAQFVEQCHLAPLPRPNGLVRQFGSGPGGRPR